MIGFSQRDSRWRSVLIGRTKLPMGRWGCLLVALSFASDYFGCFNDPAKLAKALSFTKDGRLIWKSLEENLCFKLKKRFYGRPLKDMQNALEEKSEFLLLEVQNYHWVAALKKVSPRRFKIMDPWTGEFTDTARYGDEITGGAILIAKK